MTFLSAFILGLVASAHCAGMCGGLQMAMQSGQPTVLRSKRDALRHLLLLNLGRTLTYVLAGAFFASVGYAVLIQLDIANNVRWLRVLTGVVVFLIGIHIAFGKRRPFEFLEPLGAALWRPMSRLINHQSNRWHASIVTGVAWGFLPCGLVYSVLVATVFSNDIAQSALTMAGFGLGTMPALILSGVLYKRFREFVNNGYFQLAGGAFFMVGGLLIISAPYWVNKEFLYDYPELLSLAFCVT